MIARRIEVAEDGSTYGDKIMVFYEGHDGGNLTFVFDPDGVYAILHTALVKMASGGIDEKNPPAGVTPEQAAIRKRVTSLVKAGVKGLLLAFGDQILTIILGKNHDKPKKGDDLLDWYTDIFTRVSIGYLMKSDTVLIGKQGENDVIEVSEISTRPIPQPESVGA